MKIALRAILFILLCVACRAVLAADINQNGQVGGLTLPTARSLSAGTIYGGVGAGTPYRNIYVGIQPIDALRLTIRQQQDERTEFTYPGIDVQVQLTEESEWIPASALGYTHAVGQRRFGGEYLVMSKRWWDFDFNLGLGWGRYMPTAAHSAIRWRAAFWTTAMKIAIPALAPQAPMPGIGASVWDCSAASHGKHRWKA